MKLVHSDVEISIVDNEMMNILSIENKELLASIHREIREQIGGLDGPFCLSSCGKELQFSKYTHFVPDVFAVRSIDRKVTNQLYNELKVDAINKGIDTTIQKSVEQIHNALFDVLQDDDNLFFDINSLGFIDILKQIKLEVVFDQTKPIFELICDYILVLRKYSAYRLFVFCNLYPVLSSVEIESLCYFANYEEIKILLIEGRIDEVWKPNSAHTVVIDHDLCVIML